MSKESQINNVGTVRRLAQSYMATKEYPRNSNRLSSIKNNGVKCKICKKKDFEGDCYKCSICVNYNLCSSCISSRFEFSNHPVGHEFKKRIQNSLVIHESEVLNQNHLLFKKPRTQSMHGYKFAQSEVVDSDDDESKKHNCFNVLLEILLRKSFRRSRGNLAISNNENEETEVLPDPKILLLCIEAIEETGLQEEGIYRVPGPAQEVKEMVRLYTTDLETFKIKLRENSSLAASVLKLYFRKISEPLITADLHQDFIDSIESSKDEIVRKERIRKLFNDSIPKEDKRTIMFILDHLIKVSKHSHKNRMDFTNLSIIFGPIFLKDKNLDNSTDSMLIFTRSKQQATVVKYLLQLRSDDQLKQ